MQRVYFVCPWFGIFAGGAERAVRLLSIALRRRGVDAQVLTTCSNDLYGDWVDFGSLHESNHDDDLTRLAVPDSGKSATDGLLATPAGLLDIGDGERQRADHFLAYGCRPIGESEHRPPRLPPARVAQRNPSRTRIGWKHAPLNGSIYRLVRSQVSSRRGELVCSGGESFRARAGDNSPRGESLPVAVRRERPLARNE